MNQSELTLYITIGVPASGKSTFAKSFCLENNIKYYSSDETRGKLGTSEEDQSVTPQVFSYLRRTISEELAQGNSVCLDATNINKKDRKTFLQIADEFHATKIAFLFDRPRSVLIKQNEKRASEGGRSVPTWVIDKMINKYEIPSRDEGLDEIINK